MKTFKDLVKGQTIILNDRAMTERAVIETVMQESVWVRWEDGTTDEISTKKEVEEVEYFDQFSCGFQAIKNK
jgi:hypothetical protein